jgi:hypothetical protein
MIYGILCGKATGNLGKSQSVHVDAVTGILGTIERRDSRELLCLQCFGSSQNAPHSPDAFPRSLKTAYLPHQSVVHLQSNPLQVSKYQSTLCTHTSWPTCNTDRYGGVRKAPSLQSSGSVCSPRTNSPSKQATPAPSVAETPLFSCWCESNGFKHRMDPKPERLEWMHPAATRPHTR